MKASASVEAAIPEGRETLRDLTRNWFLYFCTFRLLEDKPGAEEVRNQLQALLADMERRAQSDPALAARYAQVEPILVYFADEVLLNSGWQEEMAWGADLLEDDRYRTRHAGTDFFARLESAMTRGEREVLEVFYRCLALGFQGMHSAKPLRLAELRQSLLTLMELGPAPADRLFPQAYEGIDARPFVKFPGVQAARILLGLAFVLAVIYGGTLLWLNSQTSRIDEAAQGVIQALGTKTPEPQQPETGQAK